MTPPRRAAAAAVTTALMMSVPACTSAPRPATADPADPQLLAVAQSLVDAGYPGAITARTDPDGTPHVATAGYDNVAARTLIRPDSEVRIGSATKTFTAVVILQMVQQGKFSLDTSIEELLPEVVVRKQGVDPTTISVRDLLQHTSGLPEYADLIAKDPFGQRNTYRSPRDMLDIALRRHASYEGIKTYSYSNTNYLVLGLIAERVTQRSIGELIADRIVGPLGLRHTYFPAPGERRFRGPHVTGYHVTAGGDLDDISESDPSWTWAAGAMISTPAELNKFMQAVLGGDLLDEHTTKLMLTGIPTGEDLLPGSTYGLGIESINLSCGSAWGHSGDIPGYQTRNAVASDGTAVTVTVTALPFAIFQGPEEELLQRYRIVIDTLDQALCR